MRGIYSVMLIGISGILSAMTAAEPTEQPPSLRLDTEAIAHLWELNPWLESRSSANPPPRVRVATLWRIVNVDDPLRGSPLESPTWPSGFAVAEFPAFPCHSETKLSGNSEWRRKVYQWIPVPRRSFDLIASNSSSPDDIVLSTEVLEIPRPQPMFPKFREELLLDILLRSSDANHKLPNLIDGPGPTISNVTAETLPTWQQYARQCALVMKHSKVVLSISKARVELLPVAESTNQ